MKLRRSGYKPVTAEELENMSDDELQNLFSVCWHEGRLRCETTGITDVSIENGWEDNGFIVEWSDDNGDPSIYVDSMNELIDDVGDGEWDYGLYKKK